MPNRMIVLDAQTRESLSFPHLTLSLFLAAVMDTIPDSINGLSCLVLF